jgi:hypothetical protein
MPGMVMPGCATTVPSRSQIGPPIIELALIVVIVLSTYVLFIFIWRYLQRGHIASYQTLPDLLGHAAHALGMIGMALLMIGTVTTIGPLVAYLVAFGAFAVLFLVRLTVGGSSRDRRAESWHFFINASMAYMFSATNIAAITAACLVIYVCFIGLSARTSRSSLEGRGGGLQESPSLRLLGVNGDITIAVSMMLMLTVTQWPQWFT